jgi:uncharacterized tellurite resistance protein B-like protein
MRSYAIDGPQAMSRILALTMIVDGHVCPSEVNALRNAPFLEQVGVDAETFDHTMRELCEDLLLDVPNRNAGLVEINQAVLDEVLAEIQDPLLQMRLLKAMLDIVHADGLLDSRETLLVRRAANRWTHALH